MVVNEDPAEDLRQEVFYHTIAPPKENFYSAGSAPFPNLSRILLRLLTDVMDDDVYYELYDMSGRLPEGETIRHLPLDAP